MDEREIRLRCVEAASRHPAVHNDGPGPGVLALATLWFDWVISERKAPGGRDTLHLPKKS